jgi:serine-type D-Ala-D-Ala carboxypeptidase/endopeptidase
VREVGLAEAQEAADRSIPRWIERGRAVGLVLGLSRGDEISVKTYGSSGTDRPLGADTILEIGSITKTFTGVLLADMATRHQVGLEDPIGRYLETETPRARDRQITLLDLATHTARLPRSGRTLIRQSLRNRKEPFTAFTTEDLYATVTRTGIRRGLGTKMSYSNIGFGLLGHVLSLAGGKPYEKLVVDRVCSPLGLKDTSADVPRPEDRRAARGHRRGARPAPPLRIPTLAGAGALRSTVVDMVTYLRAHLHPERTPIPEVLRLAIGPHRSFRRGKAAIGLGWLHVRQKDRTIVWHNGGTVGFGSMAAFDPAGDGALVMLSNSRYLLRMGRAGIGLLTALTADAVR